MKLPKEATQPRCGPFGNSTLTCKTQPCPYSFEASIDRETKNMKKSFLFLSLCVERRTSDVGFTRSSCNYPHNHNHNVLQTPGVGPNRTTRRKPPRIPALVPWPGTSTLHHGSARRALRAREVTTALPSKGPEERVERKGGPPGKSPPKLCYAGHKE